MFVESSVVDKKHLNFIIGTEKKLNNLLKKLKASETNSEIEYKKLKRAGFSLVFYMACAKLIQRSFSNVRHSKPTLSAIKTPSYNLEKFLVSLIEPITKNNFTSFEFSKETCEQNSEYFMANLDVECLFTNIRLK